MLARDNFFTVEYILTLGYGNSQVNPLKGQRFQTLKQARRAVSKVKLLHQLSRYKIIEWQACYGSKRFNVISEVERFMNSKKDNVEIISVISYEHLINCLFYEWKELEQYELR